MLFTHAETPEQPEVLVLVGDGEAVVAVGLVVGVVVGVGEPPETGHVFPRTVSIHDDVASGYYHAHQSGLFKKDAVTRDLGTYLPHHHASTW